MSLNSNASSAPATSRATILDAYVTSAPSPQNALDIFQGEWSSRFPPPFDELRAGGIPLFQDSRFAWGLSRLGGVEGQSVLELGPLEGGHGYMLERSGAAQILSIEANTHAFLKCLIAKELLNLQRVRFQCGDFISFLENSEKQFDLIVASGVLYHMKDPVHLLQLISQHTKRAYLWTHYYDESIVKNNPYVRPKFTTRTVREVHGQPITLYRQEYGDTLDFQSYCGGSNDFSHWLGRDDLLNLMRHFGFKNLEIGVDEPLHGHGPAMAIVATR